MKNNFLNINILVLTLLTINSFTFSNNYYLNIPKTPYMRIGNYNAKISSERAKEIALKHAGVPKNSARFTKIKVDTNGGIATYEPEFYFNNREYEYSINANNGEILEFEID